MGQAQSGTTRISQRPSPTNASERNLSGAKLQWLQMSQLAQLGVVSFAHQKEVMKAVRPIDLHIAPNISPHMSRRRS